MKIYLDTNVILDVVLIRHPFFSDAQKILEWCEEKTVPGYTSVLSFSNIAYIQRPRTPPRARIPKLIALRSIITPVDVTATILDQALYSNFKDFEDAMQYFCARSCGADYLVTRNTEDFAPAEMAVVTPKDFLSIYHSLQ